jgi:hypothetical protein
MTHRMNIRNAMVPMTVAEARAFRDSLAERGDSVGAYYAEEFVYELEEEFDGCETDEDWD